MRLLYVFIAALLVVAFFAIIYSFMGRSSGSESRDLSQVVADAKAGDVKRIEVRGDRLKIELDNGTTYTSRKEEGASIVDVLQREGVKISQPDGVEISVRRSSTLGNWLGLLISFFPILLVLVGGLVFVILNTRRSGRGAA